MDDEMKPFVDCVRQHYDAIPAVPLKDKTIDHVYALFSADTIQAQSKARGIVTSANGKTYIVTGAYWHGNDDRYILGHECIPVAAREAHHPQPQTCEERNVEKNWSEWFYNGRLLNAKASDGSCWGGMCDSLRKHKRAKHKWNYFKITACKRITHDAY